MHTSRVRHGSTELVCIHNGDFSGQAFVSIFEYDDEGRGKQTNEIVLPGKLFLALCFSLVEDDVRATLEAALDRRVMKLIEEG